jgi:hypothetical protein
MEFIKVSLHFIDKSPHDFSEKINKNAYIENLYVMSK